jgi:GTP-binding protein
MGGLGNPHFVTKSITRPKYGTKGDEGMKVEIQLELKLLADVGLVGLPNAGKSTLSRAITNSRARIGNCAFTTLQPYIGTVVLDNHKGRPLVPTSESKTGVPRRTNFTIADIPGLIEDAHLDRRLGLGFLRHIERAGILAFVVDLSAGDAIKALQGLWKEVGQYELLRDREVNAESERCVEEQKELVRYSPLVAPQRADIFGADGNVLFNPDGVGLEALSSLLECIDNLFDSFIKGRVLGTHRIEILKVMSQNRHPGRCSRGRRLKMARGIGEQASGVVKTTLFGRKSFVLA